MVGGVGCGTGDAAGDLAPCSAPFLPSENLSPLFPPGDMGLIELPWCSPAAAPGGRARSDPAVVWGGGLWVSEKVPPALHGDVMAPQPTQALYL